MAHPLVTDSDVAIIQRGGLVIFPTETLYGLGCCATNKDALQRVFTVKGRAPGQPPPILVAGADQLQTLISTIPDVALKLMQEYWPGPLTLVLPARSDISPLLTAVAPLAGIRTIGVRRSAHPVAQALCEAVGAPIVATSANYSGAVGAAATPRSLADIPETLQRSVDVVIDGSAVAGQPSTVVDCTGSVLKVLREGVLKLPDSYFCAPDG